MAFDLLLNNNGDLFINSKKDIDLISGNEEITQRIKNRIGTFKGEWKFNLSQGVDWLGYLGQRFTSALEQQIRTDILKNLQADPDVSEVLEVNIRLSTKNEQDEVSELGDYFDFYSPSESEIEEGFGFDYIFSADSQLIFPSKQQNRYFIISFKVLLNNGTVLGVV